MKSAFAFLTIFGGARPPDAKSLRWFPVVGALIGALLAAVGWGAEQLWPPAVVAALVLAADLAFTGLLHLDGLADSADGLLAPMDRERRLTVMRQPDVGAFAIAVVTVVLLLRWTALPSAVSDNWLILVPIWAAGRTAVAVIPALVGYARSEGLASSFMAGANRLIALWLMPISGLAYCLDGLHGLAGVAALVAAAALMTVFAKARLGGFTGDVLGAAIVIGETVALLALAANR